MSEAFKEPADVRDVEVDVVREVGANVGVSAHQGAVQGGPADTDHHGDQTEQQQDQARVSGHLIYKSDRLLDVAAGHTVNMSTLPMSYLARCRPPAH